MADRWPALMTSSTNEQARRSTPVYDSRQIDTVAVVVPAHNEERWIGRCLQSLRRATTHLKSQVEAAPAVHILVVLDDCTDGTSRMVAEFPNVSSISIEQNRVGVARRAGAAHLLQGLDDERCWLASTDADCVVPPQWLTEMTKFARRGTDLVLGTVVPWPMVRGALLQHWKAEYHSTDGHPHVHGANLGIGGRAYEKLGGWPPVASQEDVLLAERARAVGLTIARTGSIPVLTSSRLDGRAPSGFADYLRGLEARSRPRARDVVN